MVIDFSKIEEEVLPHFNGGEKEYVTRRYVDDKVKIMKGRLMPGASIGMHTHKGNSEVIFMTSGTGTVICDGEKKALSEGQCHYCPEGHTHSLANESESDIEFFAVVAEQ